MKVLRLKDTKVYQISKFQRTNFARQERREHSVPAGGKQMRLERQTQSSSFRVSGTGAAMGRSSLCRNIGEDSREC